MHRIAPNHFSSGMCRCLIVTAAIFSFAEQCLADSPAESSETIELSSAVRERCLAVLRDGLRSEEFWPSIHAAEGLTLGGHGTEVRAYLTPLISEMDDDQQRCGVARELVRAGDREHARVMFEILAGDDSYGHVHAAESLFKVGELGDGVAMRRAFRQEENLRLRLMSAAALGKAGDPAAMEFLRAMLGHDDPEVYKVAAWILGRISDEQDMAAIRKNIPRATDALTRAYQEHALAALGDEAGLKALAMNLESADPAVRVYAATFAGDARAVSVMPQLVRLLDDSVLDVRVRAAQSLLVLSQSPADSNDLSVLNAEGEISPDRMWYSSLQSEAHRRLDRRLVEYEQIESLEECRSWQEKRREFFINQDERDRQGHDGGLEEDRQPGRPGRSRELSQVNHCRGSRLPR